MKRLLIVAGVVVTIATAFVGACVWLLSRDEVIRLRAIAAKAEPVPPALRAAILAAENPLMLIPTRSSLRAWMPPRRGTVRCGPQPLAFVLVKAITPPRRTFRSQVETIVSAHVVGSLFTSEELLRIYAHELYLGTVRGRDVRGVETASRFYFGKRARDLTVAEAATLGAMIRAPNVFSPSKNPSRLLDRRNRILAEMERLHFIQDRQFQSAFREPLMRSGPVASAR
jgi:membrane carboxypeptidase/penicillin-binding protein PbpC